MHAPHDATLPQVGFSWIRTWEEASHWRTWTTIRNHSSRLSARRQGAWRGWCSFRGQPPAVLVVLAGQRGGDVQPGGGRVGVQPPVPGGDDEVWVGQGQGTGQVHGDGGPAG